MVRSTVIIIAIHIPAIGVSDPVLWSVDQMG